MVVSRYFEWKGLIKYHAEGMKDCSKESVVVYLVKHLHLAPRFHYTNDRKLSSHQKAERQITNTLILHKDYFD